MSAMFGIVRSLDQKTQFNTSTLRIDLENRRCAVCGDGFLNAIVRSFFFIHGLSDRNPSRGNVRKIDA